MLNKYIKSDIKDGFNSLKIGIYNLFNALIVTNDQIEYKLNFNIHYLVLVGIIYTIFPNSILEYADNSIFVNIENKIIKIQFDNDCIVFRNY